MSKRIINYLAKLLSDKKRVFLISLLIFLGLFIFRQAHAILGTGLFDFTMAQLDALDFVENIVLQFAWFLLLLLVESLIFVVLAANLLQWVVNLPIGLHNDMVMKGWNFNLGLVNILFILIFVFIALATILKLETYGMKKTLPKLIAVALLINFSLVLIGAVVDIAQIFQYTFLDLFGNNFVTFATKPIEENIIRLVPLFVSIPIAAVVAAIFPIASPWVMIGFAFFFLAAELVGSTITVAIILIILQFLMGAIFFLFFVFFVIRIVAIWLLAIFAPLAFLCFILPPTKKYFDRWLHLLLQWTFFGVGLLFLLGLGLTLFNQVIPPSEPIPHVYGQLPGFLSSYLFLLIYLGIVLYASWKFAPAGARIAVKGIRGLVGAGIIGAKKLAPRIQRGLRRAAPEKWKRGAAEMAAMRKPIEWGRGWKGLPYPKVRALGRWVTRVVGPEAAIADIEKVKKEAMKFKTVEDAVSYYRTRRLAENRVGSLQGILEKFGTKEVADAGVKKHEIEKTMREALKIHPKAFKPLKEKYVDIAEKIGEDETIDRKIRERAGITLEDKDRDQGIESISEKILRGLERRKLEKVDISFLLEKAEKRTPEEKSAVDALFKLSGYQIGSMARKFGRTFSDAFLEELKAKKFKVKVEGKWKEIEGPEGLEKYNPLLYKYLKTNPGARAGGIAIPEKETEEKPPKKKPPEEKPPKKEEGLVEHYP